MPIRSLPDKPHALSRFQSMDRSHARPPAPNSDPKTSPTRSGAFADDNRVAKPQKDQPCQSACLTPPIRSWVVAIDGGRIDPLLDAAAARLRADSDRVRALTEHHGEAGRGREDALHEVLRGLLPGRIGIRSGSILGKRGLTSGQLDLILCDLDAYPDLSYGEGASLVLPGAVFGVISVKTELRPTEMPTYFREANAVKALLNDALDREWTGFCALFAYCAAGSDSAFADAYHAEMFKTAKRQGLDLVAALGRGSLLIDLATFRDLPTFEPPAFLAARTHGLGIALDAARIDSERPFADFYKLIFLALDAERFQALTALEAIPPGELLPGTYPGDPRFIASFAGKSADLVLPAGAAGTFTILYANVGSRSWSRASGTEARLALGGPKGHVTPPWGSGWVGPERPSAQAQDEVPPGTVAAFTFKIAVPDSAQPGTYRFFCRPIIEAIGPLTPETRAHAVTVVAPR